MTHLIRHADRPLRESMPTPDGFEALDRTHREVMDMLQQLQSLVEHLDAHGVDAQARESARAISSFFNDHARRHHADEETQVFPALLGSDQPDLVQHVRRLQQDHGWLEEDWLELAPQLQAVADGYSWYDLDMLRHALPLFEQLYREHIVLEESVVYPEARRLKANLAAGVQQRRG